MLRRTKSQGYLILHLNLAFSSIDEDAWADVIHTCYHPLLKLLEQTDFPIGVELTGWTLKQIQRIDPSWVEQFKLLLKAQRCELIGSGYCQIIGPLVPHVVNEWNQRLGMQEYVNILSTQPNIALVNEMAYSNSLVELYEQAGYHGLIMDRDNVRLSLGLNGLPMNEVPTHALGAGDTVLPVVWSDSILFQKFQHFAHGDIAIDDYLDYLKQRIADGETLLPIYCNDAEVFDYRPGRFSEEQPVHIDGEWTRIINILKSIADMEMKLVSPTQALEINNQSLDRKVSYLTSASQPIIVKKQAKYNIARWAVTGRDDLWLNTMCHRISKHFTVTQNENQDDWRELCELWSSDLRTHITPKRWEKAKNKLNACLARHKISDYFGVNIVQEITNHSLDEIIGQYSDGTIDLDRDGILLRISTSQIKIALNLRRGLAIESLSVAGHKMKQCIGTLPHGYFSTIALGADYYSGGVVIELPTERRRITDLEKVTPYFRVKENGDLVIKAKIDTIAGNIHKMITISKAKEGVSINYDFPEWVRPIGSIRLGVITLWPEMFNKEIKVRCVNGGEISEEFKLNGDINHGSPSSGLVSCSSGLGATTGFLDICNGTDKLHLSWKPEECAVMPMIQHQEAYPTALSRIFFSMLELDDTVVDAGKIGSFGLTISGNTTE